MGVIPDSMIVWQWKEYEANHDGGANIPLAMKTRDQKLHFEFQPTNGDKVELWSTPVKKQELYTVGIEILAKTDSGHVRLWWNGEPVTFTSSGSKAVTGNMFPGRSDPKFGTYGGEGMDIDTFVYQVQIGNIKRDLDGKFMS